MNSIRTPAPHVAFCILYVLATALLAPSPAQAQAPLRELLIPLNAKQLNDVVPAQAQRIDQIRQRRTTASVTLARLDVAALRGNSARFSIPKAKSLTLSRARTEERSATDFTWLGSATNAPGTATFVVHGENVTGTVRSDGILYRIEPVGNGVHAIIQLDESRFPPEHPPSFQSKEKIGSLALPRVERDATKDVGPINIDVLVAYTPAARTAVSDISATVQLAVAESNQSYVNSGINIKLTLVDSFEVSYSEAGKSFDAILGDFVGMPTVNARRNQSKADVAMMIVDQSDYCGLADAIMANASTAYAVVYYDCATGYYSFAHELGHLQGARHDPTNDPTPTPFAYGHGFQHLQSPSWRTIMAYNCSPSCPRLQYWSNPRVSYGGQPMGTAAKNDNARVLNETAETVAAFRPIPYLPTYQQGDPGNGIGGYDLRSPADRAFAFDYEHSGKLDHIALYRPRTGTFWILKNSGGAFTPVYHQGDPGNGIGGYDLKSPADQSFAFDYDHSGKSDHIALYRPGTGTFWILKNSGGTFTPVYHQGDPGNGIGGYDLKSPADRAFAFDYDHSGKSDHIALYRPGTGTLWILKNSGGTFTPVYHQGDPGNGIGGYDLKSPADRAFAFDYDHSGKLDHIALYRPKTGTFWILKNSGGTFTPVYHQGDPGNGIGGYDLKSAADRAFAFDYERSGKLDHLALYRPATGTFWILKNSGGTFTPVYHQGDPGSGIGGYDLRSPADQSFAFDFDHSGKSDHIALYRPGTGTFWILERQ